MLSSRRCCSSSVFQLRLRILPQRRSTTTTQTWKSIWGDNTSPRTTRSSGGSLSSIIGKDQSNNNNIIKESYNSSTTPCRRHYSSSQPKQQQEWNFPKPIPPPSQQDVESNGLPLLQNVVSYADRPFLIQQAEEEKDSTETTEEDVSSTSTQSYRSVLEKAASVTTFLRTSSESSTSCSSPFVAHSALAGSNYISCQWGIFACGKVSVPLSTTATLPELEHVLTDSNPSHILICEEAPNCLHIMQAAVNLNMLDRITYLPQLLSLTTPETAPIESLLDYDGGPTMGGSSNHTGQDDDWKTIPALLLYTSGTTGKPKGVVHRHGNLYHQITDLIASWEWSSEDVALHLLPLHHVHGVVNILGCASFVGGQIQFAQPFHATKLWKDWAAPAAAAGGDDDGSSQKPTVLMAVPTIYAKLLEAAEKLPPETIERAVANTLKPMRLQVSGSAALPVSIMNKWESLTGHRLLERYGMTEFAMALSNPYCEPMSNRHPGHVGLPLPSVDVRLVDEDTGEVLHEPNVAGAIQVKGPTVFTEYLNRPEATAEEFTEDGYFKTGDVALYNAELNSYRILGRKSVDILKVGGYKISALEIERELLEHPQIVEVAVVGVDDETWGQRVGLIGRLTSDGDELSLEDLQDWCSSRLSKYKIPTKLLWVSEIPKNAMGKVNKKELVVLFEEQHDDGSSEK